MHAIGRLVLGMRVVEPALDASLNVALAATSSPEEEWQQALDMLCAERLQMRLEPMEPYSEKWERYQVLDRMIESHLDVRPTKEV